MTITSTSYKWYQPTLWSDVATTNGGAINTSATITTATSGNIFQTITNAERISGVTKYRKIFWKNEDTVTYPGAKAYISSVCTSTYTTLYMTPATANDYQVQATAYTWYQPYSVGATDALNFGDMITGSSTGIWLKLIVAANTVGFDSDQFIITVEDTY